MKGAIAVSGMGMCCYRRCLMSCSDLRQSDWIGLSRDEVEEKRTVKVYVSGMGFPCAMSAENRR